METECEVRRRPMCRRDWAVGGRSALGSGSFGAILRSSRSYTYIYVYLSQRGPREFSRSLERARWARSTLEMAGGTPRGGYAELGALCSVRRGLARVPR